MFFRKSRWKNKSSQNFLQAWGAFSEISEYQFLHQTELTRNSYNCICKRTYTHTYTHTHKVHVFKRRGNVSFSIWVYIFSKVIVFHVFCKKLSRIRSYAKELQTKKWWFFMKWTQSDHMWKSYKQQNADFFIKTVFRLLNHQTMYFSASDPSKICKNLFYPWFY